MPKLRRHACRTQATCSGAPMALSKPRVFFKHVPDLGAGIIGRSCLLQKILETLTQGDSFIPVLVRVGDECELFKGDFGALVSPPLAAAVGNRNKALADAGCCLLQFGYYGQRRRTCSLCIRLPVTGNSVKLGRPNLAAEWSFCCTGQPWSGRVASVRGQELRRPGVCPTSTSGFPAPAGTASPMLFLGGRAKSCHSSKPSASCKIPEHRDALDTSWVGRADIQTTCLAASGAMLCSSRTP